MFQSLYSRIVWVLAALFILMAVIMFFSLQHMQRVNQDLANQRMHQQLAAHVAKDLNPWPQSVLDKAEVKEAFHVMMILGPAIELYVTDLQGNLLAYDASPTDLKRMQVDVNAINEFLESDLDRPIYGIDPRSNSNKVFSATQIQGENGPKGYLYIIIGGQDYDQIWSTIKSNQSLLNLMLLMAVSLTMLFGLTLVILRFITFPIKAFRQSICDYQQSNFTQDIDLTLSGSRDIRQLQQVVGQMAQRINEQFSNLKLKDQQRKDMLVQISHDLRTPIAAQQAYLETLTLHQGQLSTDKQQHFIDRAYHNAELLKQRVSEIIELTRLEQGLEKLELAPVELSKLSQSLKAAIEPIARKEKVQISLDCPSGFALAQDNKLHRILLNLLENAVKHCQGNAVKLIIKHKGNAWQFNVIDNGPGIAQEVIGNLFKPYYRVKQDRSEHLGLGLAICHHLVDLHGATLRVNSQLGTGTRFYFTLAAAEVAAGEIQGLKRAG